MMIGPDDLEPADRALAVQPNVLRGELEVALKRANDFAKAEKALNTRRAYTADLAAFRAWCAGRGVPALPATAETVAAYLSAEADRGIKASRHRASGVALPRSATLTGWLDCRCRPKSKRCAPWFAASAARSVRPRRRKPRRRTIDCWRWSLHLRRPWPETPPPICFFRNPVFEEGWRTSSRAYSEICGGAGGLGGG
jgi:hypothetical protein